MQVRAAGQAKVSAMKSLEDARAMLNAAQSKMDKAMADETLAEAQLKVNGDKLEVVKAKHVATIAKLKQETDGEDSRARAPKRRTDHEVSSEEDKLLENLAGLLKSEAAKGTVASIDALHAATQSCWTNLQSLAVRRAQELAALHKVADGDEDDLMRGAEQPAAASAGVSPAGAADGGKGGASITPAAGGGSPSPG